MYIQITTRCNMHCSHCDMNCTEKGEDMTIDTFRSVFDKCELETVTIGGGEPTIHPLFTQMLFEAIGNSDYVWLATNGSKTEIALTLAKMAKKGVIGVALSRDIYHDPIDERVIDAFTKPQHQFCDDSHDGREIRDVTGKEVKAGRCDFGSDKCICEDLIVKPDGTLKACGCEDAPSFGNVNDEINIPENWESGTCHKKQGTKW